MDYSSAVKSDARILEPVSPQYFIAKTVQDNQFVLLLGNRVIGGPYSTATEAANARDRLLEANAHATSESAEPGR